MTWRSTWWPPPPPPPPPPPALWESEPFLGTGLMLEIFTKGK